MDLKALLGETYRSDMTLAEIEAALAGIVIHTDAEVKANFVSKNIFDRTASQLAEVKRNGAAAASQAKTELEQALERIGVLESEAKENKRTTLIADTKASLIAQGYDEALAGETATAMADNDMAKVIVNQGKFLAAQKQSMREELMRGTPAPAAGGSAAGGVDYAKLKADALNAGNDVEYMRLCREEVEQATKK